MTGSKDSVDVVRQVFEKFAAGDMTGLEPLLAPEIVWHVHGHNVLTGEYRGREQTFDMFGRLYAVTGGTFSVRPTSLVEVRPGVVLALARLRVQGNGIVMDEKIVQELEVKDGQVTSAVAYLLNGQLFDRLVGPKVIHLAPAPRATASR